MERQENGDSIAVLRPCDVPSAGRSMRAIDGNEIANTVRFALDGRNLRHLDARRLTRIGRGADHTQELGARHDESLTQANYGDAPCPR
jgi:hypothetical protein